jgi:hypothetical protein
MAVDAITEVVGDFSGIKAPADDQTLLVARWRD